MPKLGEATTDMELLPVILYTSCYSWIWSGLPHILEIPVFGLEKANTFRLKLNSNWWDQVQAQAAPAQLRQPGNA